MKQYRKILAGAVFLAGLLCLPGIWEAMLARPAFFSFLVYLETGRVIRPPLIRENQETEPPTLPPATETVPETAQIPAFIEEDLEAVSVLYRCDYRPDLSPLMEQPLSWDLTDGAPAVLIVHTHGTECYTPGEGDNFSQHEPYRTRDTGYNMIAMGRELARLLEAGGIRVIHDTQCHDDPDYNRSYINARDSIARYLQQYPSIRMVLDLHRDASDSASGQLVTAATVNGQRSAQLLVMVGTDAGGNYHPAWQENLALGLKLTALLERENPGICRPVTLRSERFNTDMTAGSLLIEVGAAGNTRQEALIAVHALAEGILALAHGANC